MMSDLRRQLLWKYYYRYKQLGDVDVEGGYTFLQKILMFINITKVNLFGEYLTPNLLKNKVELNPGNVSNIISDFLSKDEPCMVARFGANEQRIVANYISIVSPCKNVFKSILGKTPFWWWNKRVRKEFNINAGFFPDDTEYLERYAKMMIEDTKCVDVLLTWFGWESLLLKDNNKVALVGLQEAEPWWQPEPWSRYLKGKKVLVIHPFADLIESQYKNRNKLFKDPNVLPEFELRTLKAVQSIGGKVNSFINWFDALEWMERQMDKIEYDVVLIGCGAYGFCLAAHAKRNGKIAIHMGGVLQLFFGIKGNRWEDKNYHPTYDYTLLFNEFWVKPDSYLRPDNAEQIEGACYW